MCPSSHEPSTFTLTFQMEAMRLSYEEKLKKAKSKEDSSADKLLRKINEEKKSK